MDLFYGPIYIPDDLESWFYTIYDIPRGNYISAFGIARNKKTTLANAYVRLFKNVDTGEEVSYEFNIFSN